MAVIDSSEFQRRSLRRRIVVHTLILSDVNEQISNPNWDRLRVEFSEVFVRVRTQTNLGPF